MKYDYMCESNHKYDLDAKEQSINNIDNAFCQFSTYDGVHYSPAHKTVNVLPPGVYEILSTPSGISYERIPVKTDKLITFPETNSELVINEIKNFWDREHIFRKFKLMFQRGIILFGPPGSGKSSTIQLIVADVIERKGVVFKFTHPHLFREGIRIFKQIQPDTPVVVLMEDIDGILNHHSESEVLNILDGVDQIDKVIYLATTNYPEDLGDRILNRPSRFDKRFKMAHPGTKSREIYFNHLVDQETMQKYNINLKKWVQDTENMSIAHLKELFVNVCILGNDYNDAIKLLRDMNEERPSSKDDVEKASIGFDNYK
jgi:SpoVK/Ycf46/Vps4 family AAA+-type ATPase